MQSGTCAAVMPTVSTPQVSHVHAVQRLPDQSLQVAVFNHSGEVVMGASRWGWAIALKWGLIYWLSGGNEPWLYTWATSGALLCRAASTNSSVFTATSDRVNKVHPGGPWVWFDLDCGSWWHVEALVVRWIYM